MVQQPNGHLPEALRAGLWHGKAMQVDPVKHTLNAPGNKRLKLKYAELLSNFAFKFNLRRYSTGNPSLALPPELNDIVQIQCSRPVEEGAPAGRACALPGF
jgi:hypothetical protein